MASRRPYIGRAFTRNVGAIVMDLGGTERIDLDTFAGMDCVTLHDVSGTALTELD